MVAWKFSAALLFVSCAQAQTVGLHLASAHTRSGLNGTNPGVYVRFDNGATFGTFRNSYRQQSVYAGFTFETDEWRGLSAAITVGAVTGYPAAKVMALAVPSVAFKGVRIGLVPKPPSKGTAASLHLMVEHHF